MPHYGYIDKSNLIVWHALYSPGFQMNPHVLATVQSSTDEGDCTNARTSRVETMG